MLSIGDSAESLRRFGDDCSSESVPCSLEGSVDCGGHGGDVSITSVHMKQ